MSQFFSPAVVRRLVPVLRQAHYHAAPNQPVCTDVPEAPYSDKWAEQIHRTVDVVHVVAMAVEMYGPELAGLLGVAGEILAEFAAPVLGIVAGAAAPFLAIGAGYWQGRREESVAQMRRGYALGVVTGIGGESWPLVKERLFMFTAPFNSSDQDLGNVSMKAHNLGLATGFLCGHQLSGNFKKVKFFWDSIVSNASSLAKAEFARQRGLRSQYWPRDEWFDFYNAAAGAFTKLYLKE
jgi:hypothetical protein